MDKAEIIILGVIGFDVHAVGNRILERVFSEAGFRVVNLGVMVSQDEFIAAARENGAEAILVSSLYGHAAMDCAGFRDKCREAGLGEIVLYLGGNLSVGKDDFPAIDRMFRTMGFDRVFPPECDLPAVARLLREDCLGRRSPPPGNENPT